VKRQETFDGGARDIRPDNARVIERKYRYQQLG
jgi:hypothetical protein